MGVMRGPAAAIVWGYHDAATLGAWTLNPATSTLTAEITKIDAFRVSQRPVTFQVTRPTQVWRWPILTLQIVDRTLTATLGPPED